MKTTRTMRLASVLCALAVLGAARDPAADEAPIKIGLSQIASGIAADYWSRQVNKPALLAIDGLQAAGWIKGRKVVGILEDNQGSATTRAAVAHKLIEIDKVNMIFVAPTPAAHANMPIAQDAGIPVVSTSISPKKIMQEARGERSVSRPLTGKDWPMPNSSSTTTSSASPTCSARQRVQFDLVRGTH